VLGAAITQLTLTPGITGRLLFLTGADDHVIPPEHQRLLAAALSPPHELVIYPGTAHGFFCDRRPAMYDPAAAADAWQRIVALLSSV
jgi:carboxymethylenebutenolidase